MFLSRLKCEPEDGLVYTETCRFIKQNRNHRSCVLTAINFMREVLPKYFYFIFTWDTCRHYTLLLPSTWQLH